MRLFSLSVFLVAAALAVEIPIRRVQRNSDSFASGIPIDLDTGSSAYVGVVSIGNPGQDINVAFDVRTSALWVPDASCSCGIECESAQLCSQLCAAHCCTKITGFTEAAGSCSNKNVFDPSKSRTYVKGRGTAQLPFLNNTIVANLSFDTFRMGTRYRPGLTAHNLQFGLVKEFGGIYKDLSYDGVFGIGLSADGGLSSPIKQLADHGVIPSPVLTVYLLAPTPDNIVDGVLTLGQLDNQRCGPIKRYVNVDKREGWAFSSPTFNMSSTYGGSDPSWKGILDFSTDYIHVPKKVITLFINFVGGRVDEEGRLITTCTRTGTLFFNIGGDTVAIASTQIYAPYSGTECLVKLKETDVNAKYAFRFGVNTLRNNCVVLDFNGRLAFPAKK